MIVYTKYFRVSNKTPGFGVCFFIQRAKIIVRKIPRSS